MRGSAAATIASPGRGTPTTCWAHGEPPASDRRRARGDGGEGVGGGIVEAGLDAHAVVGGQPLPTWCAHEHPRRRLAVDDVLQQLGVPRHLVVASRRAAEHRRPAIGAGERPGMEGRGRPPPGGREVGVPRLRREAAAGAVVEDEVVVADDEAAAVARVGVGVHDDDDVAVTVGRRDDRRARRVGPWFGEGAAAPRSSGDHPAVDGGRGVSWHGGGDGVEQRRPVRRRRRHPQRAIGDTALVGVAPLGGGGGEVVVVEHPAVGADGGDDRPPDGTAEEAVAELGEARQRRRQAGEAHECRRRRSARRRAGRPCRPGSSVAAARCSPR